MSESCKCGCDHLKRSGTALKPLAFSATNAVEVSRRPEALAALKELGVNHCCGAHLTLAEAAAAIGVTVNELLTAVNASPPPDV